MISDAKGGAIIRIVYVSDVDTKIETIRRCDGTFWPVAHPRDKDGYSAATVILASKEARSVNKFDARRYIELCR